MYSTRVLGLGLRTATPCLSPLIGPRWRAMLIASSSRLGFSSRCGLEEHVAPDQFSLPSIVMAAMEVEGVVEASPIPGSGMLLSFDVALGRESRAGYCIRHDSLFQVLTAIGLYGGNAHWLAGQASAEPAFEAGAGVKQRRPLSPTISPLVGDIVMKPVRAAFGSDCGALGMTS